MSVTRRELIEGLGALGCGLLAMGLGGRPLEPIPWPWSRRGHHSARVLGAEYLRRFPDERADLLRLRGELVAAGARELVAQVRSDFERGDVVELRGWVLSRTEARLCGAAAVAP